MRLHQRCDAPVAAAAGTNELQIASRSGCRDSGNGRSLQVLEMPKILYLKNLRRDACCCRAISEAVWPAIDHEDNRRQCAGL